VGGIFPYHPRKKDYEVDPPVILATMAKFHMGNMAKLKILLDAVLKMMFLLLICWWMNKADYGEIVHRKGGFGAKIDIKMQVH
jgi:hypothetical protein